MLKFIKQMLSKFIKDNKNRTGTKQVEVKKEVKQQDKDMDVIKEYNYIEEFMSNPKVVNSTNSSMHIENINEVMMLDPYTESNYNNIEFLQYYYLVKLELILHMFKIVTNDNLPKLFDTPKVNILFLNIDTIYTKVRDLIAYQRFPDDDVVAYRLCADSLMLALLLRALEKDDNCRELFNKFDNDVIEDTILYYLFSKNIEKLQPNNRTHSVYEINRNLIYRNTKENTIFGLFKIRNIDIDFMLSNYVITSNDKDEIGPLNLLYTFKGIYVQKVVKNKLKSNKALKPIHHASKEIIDFLIKNKRDILTAEITVGNLQIYNSIVCDSLFNKKLSKNIVIDMEKLGNKTNLEYVIEILYKAFYNIPNKPLVITLLGVSTTTVNNLQHYLSTKYDTTNLFIILPNFEPSRLYKNVDVHLNYRYYKDDDETIKKLVGEVNKVTEYTNLELIKKNPDLAFRLVDYPEELEETTVSTTTNLNISDEFNLDLINLKNTTSRELVDGVKRVKNDKRFKRLSMIFYGSSGCSKTQMASYIAKELNLNLITISASDILNKFVGESENKTKELFSKLNKNTMVVVEEGDALITNREDESSKSYNDSLTNEWLVNLERFEGILVLTTNYINNLDKAVLRRFTVKTEFLPLDKSKYKDAILPYINKHNLEIDIDIDSNMSRLTGLRLGDIGNVENLILFYNITTVSKFIDKLVEEIGHRDEDLVKHIGLIRD